MIKNIILKPKGPFSLKKLAGFTEDKIIGKSNIVINPNSHPFDRDTVSYDSNNKIINFYFKNKSKIKPNNSIAGIFFMNKQIIKSKYSKKKLDLVRDILKVNKKNYCYKTIEFIKDYGTPERIANIKNQLTKNKINNYKMKKIAVFFDRDGVINKEVGVINKFNEFKILRKAIKAIKLLNLNNIPCFLVSNQAALSRKKLNQYPASSTISIVSLLACF